MASTYHCISNGPSETRPIAASQPLPVKQARSLYQRGQLGPAQTLCEAILKGEPRNFEALNLLGIIAAQTGNLEGAVILFRKAIDANPSFAAAYCNRGLAMYELGALDAALTDYAQAIAHNPGYAEAYFNRGNALMDEQRLDAALASYDQAIAIRPDYAEAHSNRGVVLNHLRQCDAALQSYDRAIAIKPDSIHARRNRSYTLLLQGDFERGWTDYEWRLKAFIDRRDEGLAEFSRRRWLGDTTLEGKRILLYSEQGLGDTIHFCRYVPAVANLGATIVLEVQDTLVTLLTQLPGVSHFVAKTSALPAFDYQCPLMSLPLAFKTNMDTIPSSVSYLHADAIKAARWRSKLGAQRMPRIGLVWSGSRTHQNDRNRSIAAAEWIGNLPAGFQYIGLQNELRDEDRTTLKLNPNVMSFAHELSDFSETAALCDCMDLVISVDTSVAHLSAALGKPTWILLPFNCDWRWLLDRSDSPWYPTVRLYRQEKIGDWTAVFARIKEDLILSFGSC